MAYKSNTNRNMLDWLIPQGMEGDIASPMMDKRGFYDMVREKEEDPYTSNEDWMMWMYQMGIDPYYMGYEGGTANIGQPWTDFEDLYGFQQDKIDKYYEQYLNQVNPLDSGEILSNLGEGLGAAYREGDWGGETPITPGAVKPIELQDLQKLHTGFYTKDYLAPQRQTLEDLFKGKKETISGFGKGISGYGKRRGLMESAGESFKSGIDNLYSTIDKYKGNAMQRIYDTIDEWGQMTSGFGG